jgi:glycosyltransferase involved in cell wall biosynthesis
VTVDVIVVTRDRPHLIGRAVASVVEAATPATRITVVDQSATSATAEVVAEFAAHDSRITHLAVNSKGSSLARNAGIAHTSADLVLFTDDDCVVAHDWVGSMIDEFANESCGGVFGSLCADDSDRPVDAADAPWLGVAITAATERREFAPHTTDLGFGHGANMAFRRTALDAVNNFDPMLGVGCVLRSWPERDIGYRMLATGHSISFQPKSVVMHNQWRTWDEVYAAHYNYAFGAGAAVAKYLRCGDLKGLRVMADWIFQLGFRQVFSGMVRWRDPRKIRIGMIHILYPMVGIWKSRGLPIDKTTRQYRNRLDSEA